MKSIIGYTLRSDGEEFMQAFKVKSIVVLNDANRIPRAQIMLLDGDVSQQDFELSNQDFFKPGKLLEIDIGYEGEEHHIFKGLILKHAIKIRESNASFLEIECKHAAVKLTVNKKNRFFYDVNDKEAVSQMLDEANLNYAIDGMSDFTHRQLVQYESTNWDFMLSRVDINSHLVLFDSEKLTIAAPSMEGEVILDCQYGSNVISFDALIDSEAQFSQVESKAWSSAEQQLVVSQGTSDFTNELGNLSSEELSAVVGDDPFFLQHTASLPEDELATWAKSKATKNELSKVIGHVRIWGNAMVSPGKIIRLTGFGDRFNGKAYVTGIRHEVANGNWTTDIQFGLQSTWFSQRPEFNALPAAGMLPAVHGLQIGIVTQLESDPENEFRIKVRLPIISNEEDGIWAQVAKGYAGHDYGFCFYPEIGDEVIICFLNEDPRKAVVLGSLHSSAKASPVALSDDNFQKGIITKSELKVIWDDEKKTITIATPGGQQIKLDDEAQKVSIVDAHQNHIEMSDQGITIESAKDLKLTARQNITIEGLNITSKANGKFAAEGNAGAEVKSNAIAVLKGSLVQIN